MANKGIFSSSNPMFKEDTYRSETLDGSFVIDRGDTMTVRGAINKSFLLLLVLLVSGAWSFMNPSPIFMWGGAIGSLVVVLIAAFKREWSPFLAPTYAALSGLFVGGVSLMYASVYNGIIFQAVTLTAALLFTMLFIYRTGLIKVTAKFRAAVVMATGAVLIVYLLTWGLSFFGIQMPFIHDNGIMGIGINLVIIGIACMNLLLDFDNFEKGEEAKAPNYMEWFSAMGLIITLVWLYLELLRLLSKLRD